MTIYELEIRLDGYTYAKQLYFTKEKALSEMNILLKGKKVEEIREDTYRYDGGYAFIEKMEVR